MEEINKIIDTEIRPLLQRDSGDLEVLDYKNNVLTIRYQGACGCCPHAAQGTLNYIQKVLREKFDPKIQVRMG